MALIKHSGGFHSRKASAAILPALVLVLFALTVRSTSAQGNARRGMQLLPGTPASLNAAPSLNCSGSVGGFDLTIDTEHSSVSGSSVICNYTAKSQGKNQSLSGFAVTVEYFCAKDTQAAWQTKTPSEDKWQPGTNPNGEISRSGNAVLFREDGEVSGFSGTFNVAEKMFLLIDAQTIATIVVHTDVKQPDAPASGPAPNPDPKMLNLDATQVVGVASAVAGAHHAIVNDLSCAGSPAPVPSGPSFPGPEPVLATIAATDGVVVTYKPADSIYTGPQPWQKDVPIGKELHYGDTICFRGKGILVLTWYDGSEVAMNDPNGGTRKGLYSQCIDVNLKRPNFHSGQITDGAAYLFEKLGDGATSLLRLTINESKDPPEVQDEAAKYDDHGTTYLVGRDMAKGASIVCVEQGMVGVTPLNASLAPFDLKAGNQVEVSASAVGPITPGCTLPPNDPVKQPDTSASGMTLQAAPPTSRPAFTAPPAAAPPISRPGFAAATPPPTLPGQSVAPASLGLPERPAPAAATPNSDVFKQAEDQYFGLKGRLAAGRITHEQFEAALKDLMIRDPQGRYWMLGVDSGKWFVHNGQTWVESQPY